MGFSKLLEKQITRSSLPQNEFKKKEEEKRKKKRKESKERRERETDREKLVRKKQRGSRASTFFIFVTWRKTTQKAINNNKIFSPLQQINADETEFILADLEKAIRLNKKYARAYYRRAQVLSKKNPERALSGKSFFGPLLHIGNEYMELKYCSPPP